MNTDFERGAEQAAALQRLWLDTASKMMQVAFAAAPNGATPEVLRQMRSGVFQGLASSWEEYLRSPEFKEGMKQWMDAAINFRRLSNDLMARARNEMQAPSRSDIDTVMLAVRHMEQRLLGRMDELSAQINALAAQTGTGRGAKRGAATRSKRARAKTSEQRVQTNENTTP